MMFATLSPQMRISAPLLDGSLPPLSPSSDSSSTTPSSLGDDSIDLSSLAAHSTLPMHLSHTSTGHNHNNNPHMMREVSLGTTLPSSIDMSMFEGITHEDLNLNSHSSSAHSLSISGLHRGSSFGMNIDTTEPATMSSAAPALAHATAIHAIPANAHAMNIAHDPIASPPMSMLSASALSGFPSSFSAIDAKGYLSSSILSNAISVATAAAATSASHALALAQQGSSPLSVNSTPSPTVSLSSAAASVSGNHTNKRSRTGQTSRTERATSDGDGDLDSIAGDDRSDSPTNMNSMNTSGGTNKREVHRERHRQLDANRRSREAAAVNILQRYAFPENEISKDGKPAKTPDKVTVLVRTGDLLKQLTEQNASFAGQLATMQQQIKAFHDERERMMKEVLQLRDRNSTMDKERVQMKERITHGALLQHKMQEKLVSAQNAAAAAAAAATQQSLLPFLGEGQQGLKEIPSPLSLSFMQHQASLSIYESLFINSSIIMLAVNMQGVLVAANRGMQRFLSSMGISYEDVIGRPICPFSTRPGFAQLKEFLAIQRKREAERLKSSADPLSTEAASSSMATEDTNVCLVSLQAEAERKEAAAAASAAAANLAAAQQGKQPNQLPPAPAHFARPYPATERAMQKLFQGHEQMVTSTHRWASKDGHSWEMQMTSYLVLEDGVPKFCVGITSDDHVVQID